MELSGLSALLSPEGWDLLNSLPPYSQDDAFTLGEKLRAQGFAPDLVAAALTQSRLRAKAEGKFGAFASGMLFTAAGLEQATRLPIAAEHANRFRAAGISTVLDITAGIGGDAMAMAGIGLAVTAYELDEPTAAVATVNLRHFPNAQVRQGDGVAAALAAPPDTGLWADPARRETSGKRIFDPAAHVPPLASMWELGANAKAMGVKVGPAIAHGDIPAAAEAQWISIDGTVVEAAVWFGVPAAGSGRSALILQSAGSGFRARSLAPITDNPKPETGAIGQFLIAPDGAVVRSGQLGVAAQELDARLLDPQIAYLTTDTVPEFDSTLAPLGRCYRVLDVMPFQVKKLRAYLRERNVGTVTIKKRGTAITPEQLRPQLALRGTQSAHIVLTRQGDQQIVLIVDPWEG